MIRVAITPAAYEAFAATLPLGSVAYELELNAKGERLIWVEDAMGQQARGHAQARESYTATSSCGSSNWSAGTTARNPG